MKHGWNRQYWRGLTALFCGLLLSSTLSALDKKEYRIFIVCDDNQREKFRELQSGFRESLTQQLAAAGAKAIYTEFETKGDKANVPGIIKAIQDGKPDLIAVVNNSGVFADTNITTKLTDPKYKFVVEDCMPVQSGVAKTWEKPGGNVTGVGVFVQFASIIKLAKMVNPKANKMYTWSWNILTSLNEFLESEMRAAAKKEGIEFVEFKRVANAEEEFEYWTEMDKKGPEYFAVPCTDAWVHRDGTYANMNTEALEFSKKNIRHLIQYAYEEAPVKYQAPAGACIIWYDIGTQMAEKAMLVLNGANPGDLPWSYPRKHNLIFNLAAAKLIGLEIPDNLIGAAYRVYTDFDGHYVGQKN